MKKALLYVLLFIINITACTQSKEEQYSIIQARMTKACYKVVWQDTCYNVEALFYASNKEIGIIEDGKALILPLMMYEYKQHHIYILAKNKQVTAIIEIQDDIIKVRIESNLFETVNITYQIGQLGDANILLIKISSTKPVYNNDK